MLLRVPSFYDSFHCIADKCTDTCCIGWEIDIDSASATHYGSIEGEFGDTLRQNIENGHFKLRPGDRCPFLRQDGLCDIIFHLGEENLCDICREHPRFVEVYGDVMEKGIGLCCEEAVRLLLTANGSDSSPIAFFERETDDIPDELPDDAREARNAIFEEREFLFKILANRNRSLNERLVEMIDYAVQTSGCSSPEQGVHTPYINTPEELSNNIYQQWIEILGKGESYGPAWDTAYKRLTQVNATQKKGYGNSSQTATSIFTDSDGEKIIAYLLFRYYAKSLFDGNSLTKVQFALYFWITLQKFGNIFASATDCIPDAKIAAIKLFSKQTEYSEEIMGILEEQFMENPAFSPDNFKRILMKQI